jgi:GTP-binding protein LepA
MQIRNFSIIAHIDHGKTTLTDRLLLLTSTITERQFRDRLMDSNPIERERGITIKLAPVRMMFEDPTENETIQLNLIDTPGHVDFSYEVSRSLAACEGVLLVVDATQGVQAQTLANYEKAKAHNLKIIPVINKIDLPVSDVESTTLELMETFGFDENEMVCVSAKTGQNTQQLLEAIVKQIPAPKQDSEKPLRALVFTSVYDAHQGVIAYVRVFDGELRKESLMLMQKGQKFTPPEIGIFGPDRRPIESLKSGEVGYIATGFKDVSQVQVGDTITQAYNLTKVEPLPGYQVPLPMVYLEFYPIDGDDFTLLQDALNKLKLHDAALQFQGTHSQALGNGFRLGFLGILHAEIVQERLEREFALELVATSPSVPYEILMMTGEVVSIHHAGLLPDPSLIREIREPLTKSTIYTPRSYLGAVMQLCEDHRGKLLEVIDVGTRVRAVYDLPLSEIIVNFHDQLKSATSGFASLEYEVTEFRAVNAVKLAIMVQGEEVEALSQIVVRDKAEQIGRAVTKKLKEVIPRQQFEIPLQAAIGGKIVARETVKAFRKDVTAKLYGGDHTRRTKLLDKQKRGKSRMKDMGKIQLPQEAFMAVLER